MSLIKRFFQQSQPSQQPTTANVQEHPNSGCSSRTQPLALTTLSGT